MFRALAYRIELPIPAEALHAAARFVEDLPSMLRRWHLRRRTVAEIRALTHAQLSDIGLDGVDPEEVARRLVR